MPQMLKIWAPLLSSSCSCSSLFLMLLLLLLLLQLLVAAHPFSLLSPRTGSLTRSRGRDVSVTHGLHSSSQHSSQHSRPQFITLNALDGDDSLQLLCDNAAMAAGEAIALAKAEELRPAVDGEAEPAEKDETHPQPTLFESLVQQLVEVKADTFKQTEAWKRARFPLRTTVLEEDRVYRLACGGGAAVVYKRLYGNPVVQFKQLQRADEAGAVREMQGDELATLFTDALATGGSAETDCVCRGGRCPRMWGCPFWVERKVAENKGRFLRAARSVPEAERMTGEGGSGEPMWKVGERDVVSISAGAEPSALLEVRLGRGELKHYNQVDNANVKQYSEDVKHESRVDDGHDSQEDKGTRGKFPDDSGRDISSEEYNVRFVEIVQPTGGMPRVGTYLGPPVTMKQASNGPRTNTT